MAKKSDTKQIWARFTPEQLEIIDAAAAEENRTRASYIANAVMTYTNDKFEVDGAVTEAIAAEEEE
jgi:uncharacterized protein (DUF1778 family)